MSNLNEPELVHVTKNGSNLKMTVPQIRMNGEVYMLKMDVKAFYNSKAKQFKSAFANALRSVEHAHDCINIELNQDNVHLQINQIMIMILITKKR